MLVIFALIVLLVALWYFSPSGRGVHGAISADRELRRPRFPLAALFTDADGDRIELNDRVPVRVSGDSAAGYGIRDGDVLITRKFNEKSRANIAPGDVVVIDSVKGENFKPWRLRKVKRLYSAEDGQRMMEFFRAPSQQVNDKPLSDAAAWVEYIRS